MFRVSISSDLPVFASKVFSSSAQARLGASASSASELTHSVPNSTPAPCRNSRRLSPGVASPPTRMGCVNMVVSSLRKCSARRSASRVVAVTLQYLDLVSVWVLHEEEACDEPVAVAELLDVVGSQSQRLDARVLAREVIHAHGDVSIAGAVGVRLGASPVQGQLKLEIVLGIAQIDERKLGEIQAARRLEAERVAVETHGPVQVEDADHGVDHFRHSNLPTARKRETLCTDRKTNLARVARRAATGRPHADRAASRLGAREHFARPCVPSATLVTSNRQNPARRNAPVGREGQGWPALPL